MSGRWGRRRGGRSYLCSCISLWVPSPQLNRYLQQSSGLTRNSAPNSLLPVSRFHGESSSLASRRLPQCDVLRSPVELGEDVDGRRVVSAARSQHLQVDGGRSVQVRPLAPALSALDPPERLFVLPLRLPTLRVGVRHGSERLEDSPGGRKVTASRRKNSPKKQPQMTSVHNKKPQIGFKPPAPVGPRKSYLKKKFVYPLPHLFLA